MTLNSRFALGEVDGPRRQGHCQPEPGDDSTLSGIGIQILTLIFRVIIARTISWLGASARVVSKVDKAFHKERTSSTRRPRTLGWNRLHRKRVTALLFNRLHPERRDETRTIVCGRNFARARLRRPQGSNTLQSAGILRSRLWPRNKLGIAGQRQRYAESARPPTKTKETKTKETMSDLRHELTFCTGHNRW